MKLETVTDPDFYGWVFAEYEPGKRVTVDLVTFDTKRRDVFVNKYGVVYFQTSWLAKNILEGGLRDFTMPI